MHTDLWFVLTQRQSHNVATLCSLGLIHRLAAQEQERRDYELALRLAQDEMQPQQAIAAIVNKPGAVQSQIAHSSLQRSTAAHRLTQGQEAARKKYNLTKWKFAELRDTINTSCGKKIWIEYGTAMVHSDGWGVGQAW